MKKIKLLSAIAFSALLAGLPLSVQAADEPAKTDAPAAADAKPAKASKPLPYAGVVSAVDKDKQSFTLKSRAGERVFMVTEKTKISNPTTKEEKKFDDITADAYVTGSYTKDGDTLTAYSVHLGKTAPMKGKKGSKAAAPAAAPADAAPAAK